MMVKLSPEIKASKICHAMCSQYICHGKKSSYLPQWKKHFFALILFFPRFLFIDHMLSDRFPLDFESPASSGEHLETTQSFPNQNPPKFDLQESEAQCPMQSPGA